MLTTNKVCSKQVDHRPPKKHLSSEQYSTRHCEKSCLKETRKCENIDIRITNGASNSKLHVHQDFHPKQLCSKNKTTTMVTGMLINNNSKNYRSSRSVSLDHTNNKTKHVNNDNPTWPQQIIARRRRQSTGQVLRRNSSVGGDVSLLQHKDKNEKLPHLYEDEGISQTRDLENQRRVNVSFGVPFLAQEFRRRASRQRSQILSQTSSPRRYSAVGVFLTCTKARWLKNEARMRTRQLGAPNAASEEAVEDRRRNIREGFQV